MLPFVHKGVEVNLIDRLVLLNGECNVIGSICFYMLALELVASHLSTPKAVTWTWVYNLSITATLSPQGQYTKHLISILPYYTFHILFRIGRYHLLLLSYNLLHLDNK